MVCIVLGCRDNINAKPRLPSAVVPERRKNSSIAPITCAHWLLVLPASTRCRDSSPSMGWISPMPERPTRASTDTLRCAMPTPDQAPHCTLLPAAELAFKAGEPTGVARATLKTKCLHTPDHLPAVPRCCIANDQQSSELLAAA